MPNMYIVAGCNGAGKTTASFTVLPDMLNCREFVNADEIARGISPFQPERVSFESGRIMLQRIDELIQRKDDFGFETTLAARTYVKTIERAKDAGYFVTLIFFWLNEPQLAIERVKIRVQSGGHFIDDQIVIRRYYAGIRNFFNLYKTKSDLWLFVDNSSSPFRLIAEGKEGKKIRIFDVHVWKQLTLSTDEII